MYRPVRGVAAPFEDRLLFIISIELMFVFVNTLYRTYVLKFIPLVPAYSLNKTIF